MAEAASIHLPLFQHFDCSSCGYCCRNLVVNVSQAERRRILDAGWAKRIDGHSLFERYRFRGRRLYRLSRRGDGRCVFHADDERCRLHAETGLETKPLACRLYPFVLTPGAGSVRVDLRGDCPCVAKNQGRSLAVHEQTIARLARETGAMPMGAVPSWRGARPITTREFEAVVAGFEGLLRIGSLPFRVRLRAGCRLLDLLYKIRINDVRDERFVELVTLLANAAAEEAGRAPDTEPSALPKRAGRLFRQWLFLHAIVDDPADLGQRFVTRVTRSWARYLQTRRFVRETGPVPRVRPEWPDMDFAAVARVQRGEDETLEPVCRSLRLKLDAHAFAGPGYFGYDLLSGLTALWLLPAAVGWFARVAAVSASREVLVAEDVLAGLRQAHHTYGVSPVFARISERLRLRAMAQPGIPAAVLQSYGP